MSADISPDRVNMLLSLAEAEAASNRGSSSLLHCAQAVEYALKLAISQATGEVPRSYVLSQLFEQAKEIKPSAYQLYEKKRELFDLMEDAYFGCPHFPSQYDKKQVKEALGAAKEVVSQLTDGGRPGPNENGRGQGAANP